jgi:glyoxylase-like metal-dependent hydrolase (beta-lactamase superfamily II)
MDDRFYFRQLLSGRDLATSDPLAQQMVNFIYRIGDRETGDAVVVDPAYDVATILDTLEADGMRLTGVLATHYHADHIGGSMMGFDIRGIREILERTSVPVHLQADEAEYVVKTTGVSRTDFALHQSGDIVRVGGLDIELIHTPGHTPGSQCFLVHDRLVPAAMYDSLTRKLAKVPDTAVLFPGHWYAPEPYGSLGETRRENYVFRPRSEEQWLMMFGR